jgi:paraquat-inducible protein B
LVVGIAVLLAPPAVLALDNQDLESENEELQSTLDHLNQQSARLQQLAATRHNDEARYKNKTPSLGAFMESEAKKQGLTLQEVTDQPGKSVGRYARRSVTVALPQAGLSPVINLLSSISETPYPVAVDHIQIDHFTPGDQYNVKLGLVTFDKQAAAKKEGASTKGDGEGSEKDGEEAQ